MENASFRSYLQAELVRRCRKNPKYSLRAFSRSLGIQSSFLSKLLSGKRAVTLQTIERLSPELALSPQEVSRFKAQLAGIDFFSEEPSNTYTDLPMDAFHVISDWYHFAILELSQTSGFRWEPRWVSQRLGISPYEVSDALARLSRVGLIKKSGRSWVVLKGTNSTLKNAGTTAAFRRLQKQVLEMAIEAMEAVPIEQRDQTTMTMAVDSSLLPEAKKRITRFRRELCDYLQKNRKTDSVYQLSVSLYPVTKNKRSTHVLH